MAEVTIIELRTAAKNKAEWTLEVQEPADTKDGNRWFGITFGKHNWHWFKQWLDHEGKPMMESDKYKVDFDHSYSQINGETKRGFTHGYNVVKSIKAAAHPKTKKRRKTTK